MRRRSTNLGNTGEGDVFAVLPDDERGSTQVVIQRGSKLDNLQVLVANVLDCGNDPEFGHGCDLVGWS